MGTISLALLLRLCALAAAQSPANLLCDSLRIEDMTTSEGVMSYSGPASQIADDQPRHCRSWRINPGRPVAHIEFNTSGFYFYGTSPRVLHCPSRVRSEHICSECRFGLAHVL